MAKKLKTPRRKSVTKPVRRYDTSGRTIGSGATTRRTTRTPKVTGVTSLQPKRKVGRPSQGKTELVTSKSGKTYRRPVRAATTSQTSSKVSPRNVYTRGRSPAIAGTGTQRVTTNRGGGFRGGFAGSSTKGGAVKQSTQAEIKAMQRQMDRERNMNRVEAQTKADMDAFDKRFRALKRKLSGIQGNPGLRGIFMGGGGSGKR